MKVLASRSQRVFPISECEPLQDDCAHRGLFFSTVHVKTSSTTTLGASPEPPPSPDSRSSRDGWPPKPRHDRRLRVDSSPAYLTAAHPVKQFKMACKHAPQRWSGLLKRIAKQVRALYVLCSVTHANVCYKDAKCLPHANSSLRPPPAHGGACSRNFNVDVLCSLAYATLCELHLDHEQDFDHHVWDGGVDGARCCATYSSRCMPLLGCTPRWAPFSMPRCPLNTNSSRSSCVPCERPYVPSQRADAEMGVAM